MERLLTPLLRAFGQLGDWRMLRVVLGSCALAGLAFAVLATAAADWAAKLAAGHGIWTGLAGTFGGFLAMLAAVWLFLPVVLLIAGLFGEHICRAVESRFYPGLPPPAGASARSLLGEAALASVFVLLAEAGALLLALVPGIGFVAAFALTSYALGRALFVPVAMRRLPGRRAAVALWRARRGTVWLQGALLAALAHLPLANLLLPVLGPAVMVHVFMTVDGAR